MNWMGEIGVPHNTRDNAMIIVGRAAALTQEMSVYMEDISATYPTPLPMPLTWQPQNENEKRIEKYYNVWYSWFYIPPSTASLNSSNTADFQWQAQFIFDIKKNQDQQRYGEDGRYSKCPLVLIDNSKQASFTDITQSYMPMIHHSRHQFQNCLVNDIHAVGMADDLIGGLLAAVDESNGIKTNNPTEPTGGNGTNAYMEQWKMIKQGGKGFFGAGQA